MASGVVFNIQRYSVQDGPGIRTTVFLKGCPLDCWWCHNPESQRPEPQIMVMEGRCIQCGECREACPQGLEGMCEQCGRCVGACPTGARQSVGGRMTAGEVLAEVRKDRIFHEESGGGVTFSGGEPLVQFEFLRELLGACRAEGIHTALDTCGHAPIDQLLAAGRLANLVLYDLKMVDEARHRNYTGVSSGRIIDNLRALGKAHENIWLRIPVIPGINDDDLSMDAAARLAASIGGVRRVCLLPYHGTGTAKLQRLGWPDRMKGTQPPSADELETTARRFRRLGLEVTTGA